MMYSCKECSKGFRTNWELKRHYGNKRKCFKTVTEQGNEAGKQLLKAGKPPNEKRKSCQKAEETLQRTRKPLSVSSNDNNTCKFCMKIFTRTTNCKKHTELCKYQYDTIRLLEIRCNLELEVLPTNVCRYCTKSFSEGYHATRHMKICPHKDEYKQKLENQLLQNEVKSNITNNINTNNTNCNNTNITNNNIINVNSIGEEDLSYLTCAVIKKILKGVSSGEEFIAKTLAYIHAHEDHPENHNIIFSNYRSNSALVKSEDKFEFKNINTVLKEATCNWLDKVCIDDDYDELPKRIKQKYESICEDDELDQTAKSMLKLDLYSKHKNGIIKKPKI